MYNPSLSGGNDLNSIILGREQQPQQVMWPQPPPPQQKRTFVKHTHGENRTKELLRRAEPGLEQPQRQQEIDAYHRAMVRGTLSTNTTHKRKSMDCRAIRPPRHSHNGPANFTFIPAFLPNRRCPVLRSNARVSDEARCPLPASPHTVVAFECILRL